MSGFSLNSFFDGLLMENMKTVSKDCFEGRNAIGLEMARFI